MGPAEEAGGAGRSEEPVRILVVDDHWVVRQGLRMFLGDQPAFTVVGEAAEGEEALRLVRDLQPDVVLMDLLMPGLDGVQATAKVKAEVPGVEVIALTSVLEDQSVVGAIRAGAIGYLLKDTRGDDLVRAIRAAAEGRVELSPDAAARLAREVRLPERTDPLTPREADILTLVAEGFANKEIAGRLAVTEKTVKTHLTRVFDKLGVESRTQAALHAIRTGLTSSPGPE